LPDDDQINYAPSRPHTVGSYTRSRLCWASTVEACRLSVFILLLHSGATFSQTLDPVQIPSAGPIATELKQGESPRTASTTKTTKQAATDAMVLDMRTSLELSQEPTPEPESVIVLAYEQSIANLEREEGPYSAALPEQMLGLGKALQQLDRHEEAITLFKRGAHLARINGGLYSAEQIAMLRGEIRSHLAVGNFTEVDARQEYLYRVERRSLANSAASVYALLDQANWQQKAFIAGIGDEEKLSQRLVVMWDLYRLSMAETMDYFGETSAELRKPLLGMLKTQYLIAGHQLFNPNGPKRGSAYVLQTGDRYRKGETVLQALAELGTINKAPVTQVIDDKLALGDWAWWFDKRTEALAFYDQVHSYVADAEDPTAAEYLASTLAKPKALPIIEGIEALPTPREDDGGELVVTFQVTDMGRVTNIERLREPDVEQDERAIGRLLRTLRDIRFRPRFQEGLPVASETLVWSWNAEAWREELLALRD